MKICVWLSSLLLSFSALCAEPNNVRVEVQIISIPQTAALTLLPALRDEKTFLPTYQRLQEMITSEEATLLAWPRVWLTGNEVAKSSSLDNFPYRSMEVDRGGTPQSFQGSAAVAAPVQQIAPPWSGPWVPPTAEVQNLGPDLSVQQDSPAGSQLLQLQLDLQFVRLLNNTHYRIQPLSLGLVGFFQLPNFSFQPTKRTVTVKSGEPQLVSVNVMPSREVELTFLKATIVQPAAKPTP